VGAGDLPDRVDRILQLDRVLRFIDYRRNGTRQLQIRLLIRFLARLSWWCRTTRVTCLDAEFTRDFRACIGHRGDEVRFRFSGHLVGCFPDSAHHVRAGEQTWR